MVIVVGSRIGLLVVQSYTTIKQICISKLAFLLGKRRLIFEFTLFAIGKLPSIWVHSDSSKLKREHLSIVHHVIVTAYMYGSLVNKQFFVAFAV